MLIPLIASLYLLIIYMLLGAVAKKQHTEKKGT